MSPAKVIIKPDCHETIGQESESWYLARHFRGEFTLHVAFWKNYLSAVALVTLTGFIVWKLRDLISSVTYYALILAYLLTLPIFQIFFIIGTWRSASRHVGRGGKRIWAFLAKAFLLIGFYCNGDVLLFQTLPLTSELGGELLRHGRTPGYEITVTNFTNGASIWFQGELKPGAEVEFENTLNRTPRAKLVVIECEGGKVFIGMKVGRMIRSAGLTTVAGAHCESAATLMFISGKERLISSTAKIGFHRPSGKWSSLGSDDDKHTAFRQFMKEAGVSNSFIDRVISTSPDDMWYPTYEEMLSAGVVTGRLK